MKFRLSFLIVLLILFMLIAGCATKEPSGEPQTNGNGEEEAANLTIVDVAEGAMPIGVPWQITGIDTKLMWPCIESLMREDINRNYHPELAVDWDINPEDNTITFKLREGVKFHDGTDFNAEAAKWNLDKQIESKTLQNLNRVEIVDDYEIILYYDKYTNVNLNELSGSYGSMISPTAYEKNGEEWARTNPVGTGPFQIEEYVIGEKLVYKRFDDYWNEGKPYLDSITYKFIRDPMTQQAALLSGEIDVLCVTDAELASTLQAQGFNVLKMSIGPVSLMPSSADPNSPLANKKVRQAISHAINRESIVEARGFGILETAYQIVPATSPAYIQGWKHEYDIEKAKKLLEEAGYPDGFEVTIYAMPGLVDRDAMVIVQSNLAQIGIDVKIETPDGGRYTDLRWGGHDGFCAQHTRDLGFNRTFHLFFRTDIEKPQFPTLARPEGYQELIAASLVTPEPDPKLGQELVKLFNEEVTVIPLYDLYEMYVLQNYVNDTGYTEWSESSVFTPAEIWLDK